jgi:hypothetical protein
MGLQLLRLPVDWDKSPRQSGKELGVVRFCPIVTVTYQEDLRRTDSWMIEESVMLHFSKSSEYCTHLTYLVGSPLL